MAFPQYQTRKQQRKYPDVIPKHILNQMPPFNEIITNLKMALIFFKIINHDDGILYGVAYDEPKHAVYCVVRKGNTFTAKWYDIEELNDYQSEVGLKLALMELSKHTNAWGVQFNPQWLEDPYVIYLLKELIQ